MLPKYGYPLFASLGLCGVTWGDIPVETGTPEVDAPLCTMQALMLDVVGLTLPPRLPRFRLLEVRLEARLPLP